jgi:hypothetical protein
MLTHKSAYKLADGIFIGEVLDFPGTVSYGTGLDDVRRNLAGALVNIADVKPSGRLVRLKVCWETSDKRCGSVDVDRNLDANVDVAVYSTGVRPSSWRRTVSKCPSPTTS